MAVLRRRRAEEVAVDTTWIRAQSKLTYPVCMFALTTTEYNTEIHKVLAK